MKIPIIDYLARAPARRTYALAAIVIIGNLVSGAFIAGLANGQQIDWSGFYRSPYFYALILIVLITGRLTVKGPFVDKEKSEAIDAFHYVRNSCLDDYAAECSKLIRKGNLEEFHTAIDRLK